MKRRAISVILLIAFFAGFTSVSRYAAAQDGTFRERLRERMQERQKERSNRQGNAAEDASPTRPGNHTFTIQHDGLTRSYMIHVPAKYSSATPTPLLFALHGGGGTMEYMANDGRYGLISRSEKEGFIVVFPNGYSKLNSGKFATWNAGNCCGPARDDKVDDVGFIRQVVNKVTQQMNIDRNRIYATGMSNGGMMAYRLACEMSDVFKAIAAVAGTDNTLRCSSDHPVSILHIHATNDTHVLFNGGAGADVVSKSAVTNYTSVAASISKWVGLNSCTGTSVRSLEKDGAYCETVSQCRGNTKVQHCVTESGGHSWPGAQKARSDSASQAISANDVIWDFFNRR